MKKKLIYFIIIFGILTVGLTTAYLKNSNVKPVSHAAVKVVLDQSPDYSLSLKSLTSENSYSSDYKLEKPFGFYRVRIVDKNNDELFSGKVEKNKVIFPPYEVGGGEQKEESGLIFQPMKELSLLLPFYKNASEVIFSDETGTEKFRIDIGDLELPQDHNKKLCGNGICDSHENIIFCYRDCRIR